MEVTINDVKKAFVGALDAEQRIAVLRMELDYQLQTLYDLMQEPVSVARDRHIWLTKERLWQIRKELMMLEVL